MDKMEQKLQFENTRKIKIFKKIQNFLQDVKESNSIRTNLFCLERIIDFIDNEFPKTKKYQKIIKKFDRMIKDKSYNYPALTHFKENVSSNLADLETTYDFDTLVEFHINLHSRVKEVSLELLRNKHYSQAVFESVKALNNYVKDKAGITDKDLSDAMAKAFNEKNPIIKLNKLKTQSDINEQRGFKLLFMGAMTGIRNPMGHETYEIDNSNTALEYLAFLSLLFRKAEEGKI